MAKQQRKYLSRRAYAIHRGVNRNSIAEGIRAGRIKLNAAGQIDVAATDAGWQVQRGPRADPKLVELRRSRLVEKVLAARAQLADIEHRYCDPNITRQAAEDERSAAVDILERFADEMPEKINRAVVAAALGPPLFEIDNLDCRWQFPGDDGSEVDESVADLPGRPGDDLEFESIADLQRILAETQNSKLVLARKVRSGELVPLKNFVDAAMKRADRMRKALYQALRARDRDGALECVRAAIQVMER
jgi:hypothetical protein